MTARPFEIRASCRSAADRLACTYEAVRFARSLGLPERPAWELGICVAELLGNSVHHGGGRGFMTARLIESPRRAIEIEIVDEGPGIASIELAVRDGYSRGRFRELGAPCTKGPGLGVGLAAVRRFADDLQFAKREVGTCVVLRKHL